MNKSLLPLLLAVALAGPAAAQSAAPVVYPYVEQMPALPGDSHRGAIKAAIEHNLHLPAADVQRRTYGRILVAFVVAETGAVASPRIVKGLTASADAAALQAVRQLPRLTPGRQDGRPVSVALTIPVEVGKELAAKAAAEAAERNLRNAPDLSGLSGEGNQPGSEVVMADKVYTYVEQMPALPGGGGQAAVVAALQQRLVVPVGAPEGKVFVGFVVGKDGRVKDIGVVKGLSASADAAVVAAVRKLPTFAPGKQNGQLVQVSLLLPVTVRQPTPK